MDKLLAPAAAVMSRLRFGGKFALVSLTFAIPVVLAIGLLYYETERGIGHAAQERRGIEYLAPLPALLQAVQEHNFEMSLPGETRRVTPAAEAAATAIDGALVRLRSVQAAHGAELGTADRAQNIMDHWNAIKGKRTAWTLEQGLDEHRALSDEILDLMTYAAERSRLLLDPQARSAYLQAASVSLLPEMVAALGQSRALMRTREARNAPLAMEYQLGLKNFAAASRAFVNAFGGSDVEIADRDFVDAKGDFEASAAAYLGVTGRRVRAGEQPTPEDLALAASAVEHSVRLNNTALKSLDTLIAARAQAERRVQVVLLAALLACLGLAAYFLLAFTRTMNRSIGEARSLAGCIAEGDLTRRLAASSRDEVGDLVTSLNDMSERMSSLVAGVKDSSDRVMSSAREVARANSELSARTERQASSLEEMAAGTEELAATVAQSTQKIEEAGGLVAGASKATASSNESMARATTTMEQVATLSRRIAEITTVMDGIAFQTNILALNAAVEAARVGAEGRGFAVVAGEIRLLAQRSAQSSKEIRDLIDSTVGAIDSGGKLVGEAGRTLQGTVESIREAVRMMEDVTAMARQQSASIDQISAAVMEMNGVTQQNAGFVQRTSQISNTQEESAQELVESVGGFRIADDGAKPAAAEEDPDLARTRQLIARSMRPVALALHK